MNRSKSSLFLLELLIIIAFFSVASAVCMQLFAIAHNNSTRSTSVQRAVINSTSVANAFKATNGDITILQNLIDGSTNNNNQLVVNFTYDWNVIYNEVSYPRYLMILDTNIYYNMAHATISVKDTLFNENLHTIHITRYLGVN